MNRYVLITPAHNEEAYIEQTIRSVLSQTVRPSRWIVVDDASTDGTRQVVERYCASYPFIELLKIVRPPGRHFGNKVLAFKKGVVRLACLDYEQIGNLDADVSFEKDYFEFLMDKFADSPRLGVAGTPFTEEDG